MLFDAKTLAGGFLALNRRSFVGALGLSAGATTTGGFAGLARAAVQARPTVAVHMDMPFVDRSGAHAPYRPPGIDYARLALAPEPRLPV